MLFVNDRDKGREGILGEETVSSLKYLLWVFDDSLVRVRQSVTMILPCGCIFWLQATRMQMLDYKSHGSEVGGTRVEGAMWGVEDKLGWEDLAVESVVQFKGQDFMHCNSSRSF